MYVYVYMYIGWGYPSSHHPTGGISRTSMVSPSAPNSPHSKSGRVLLQQFTPGAADICAMGLWVKIGYPFFIR